MNEEKIICRCEDITEEEVLAALELGLESLDELKRYLRVGMGPCQGRNCGPMLIAMIARHLNKKPSEIEGWKKRPPVKPVPAGSLF